MVLILCIGLFFLIFYKVELLGKEKEITIITEAYTIQKETEKKARV